MLQSAVYIFILYNCHSYSNSYHISHEMTKNTLHVQTLVLSRSVAFCSYYLPWPLRNHPQLVRLLLISSSSSPVPSVWIAILTPCRTLPCLHSFCHGCLGCFSVEIKEDNHYITCPVCRQTTQQLDKVVSGFQSAFLINNLMELYQVLEKVSGSKQNNCENCHKEQATGYCKQCSVLLCQTCTDKHN